MVVRFLTHTLWEPLEIDKQCSAQLWPGPCALTGAGVSSGPWSCWLCSLWPEGQGVYGIGITWFIAIWVRIKGKEKHHFKSHNSSIIIEATCQCFHGAGYPDESSEGLSLSLEHERTKPHRHSRLSHCCFLTKQTGSTGDCSIFIWERREEKER